MSLNRGEVAANWRRLSAAMWLRLLLATFLIPPAAALLLFRIFPIGLPELVGLFMVAAAPGAPLMTRGVAKKGFDMQLAASCQLWGAILTPVMIPLVVAAAGVLFQRAIWIAPTLLLAQIAKQQFLPLAVGVALMYFLPAVSVKIQGVLNRLGNVVLTIGIVLTLFVLGSKLKDASLWLPMAALMLAIDDRIRTVLLWHRRRPRRADAWAAAQEA